MDAGCGLGRGGRTARTTETAGRGRGSQSSEAARGVSSSGGGGMGTANPEGVTPEGRSFSAPLPHLAQRARTSVHPEGPCTFLRPPDLSSPRP